jgi:hypothetical protein
VTALLAFQIHANPITLGTISPSIASLTRNINVEQDTVLKTLTNLRNTIGGYISVDNDHKLNWLDDIGEDKGQQIRYKKNIKGMTRTYEFTNFGNRLYCYGEGEGTARIKLSDATGYDLDYVEDAASQATYGVCIRLLVDKSITHPDTLYAWALMKLDEMKAPRHSYTVDMVNLAAQGWTFEALQLGSYVKVVDEDLGIDINARIVKIIRDLSNPENIKVEISNPGKDIIDTMAGVYDDQQFQKSTAVKIGAGQVKVLGEFSVEDWLNAGTTTICGDNIRSGVIQSNNWGVSYGSYYDLVAGTFKLGGSASPKLSWDGVNLVVNGTIYATSGEFAGTLKTSVLEAGKILTINGSVSFAGGKAVFDSDSLRIVTGSYGAANSLIKILNAEGSPATLIFGWNDALNALLCTDAGNLTLWGTHDAIIKCGDLLTGFGVFCGLDEMAMFPSATDTVDLGRSSKKWKSIYGTNHVLSLEGDVDNIAGNLGYSYGLGVYVLACYMNGAWRSVLMS